MTMPSMDTMPKSKRPAVQDVSHDDDSDNDDVGESNNEEQEKDMRGRSR